MYETNANTLQLIVAAIEGLYDTHTQPASASYRHAKRCVRYVHTRKQYLAYFSYTETVTRVRIWDEDEIRFTSMGAIFKPSLQTKGTVYRC